MTTPQKNNATHAWQPLTFGPISLFFCNYVKSHFEGIVIEAKPTPQPIHRGPPILVPAKSFRQH